MGFYSRHEESELGTWNQLTSRPSAFAGLVESIWLFDGKLAGRERFLPTGELDLILQLNAPSESFRIVDGQPAAGCPALSLTGLIVSPLVIETPATTSRMVGVSLRPAGAFALFGTPLHELTGTAVDLHDLIGGDARRLAERLGEAGSDEECLLLLGRWIADRFAANRIVDPCVAGAVSEIERTGGQAPIANVLSRIGASPKRFANLFERQVGVKPKLYSRIVRFRGLVAALPTGEESLSDTALAHGYYDHAHMNADFRQFAGMSPRQFLAATPYPESSGLID